VKPRLGLPEIPESLYRRWIAEIESAVAREPRRTGKNNKNMEIQKDNRKITNTRLGVKESHRAESLHSKVLPRRDTVDNELDKAAAPNRPRLFQPLTLRCGGVLAVPELPLSFADSADRADRNGCRRFLGDYWVMRGIALKTGYLG